MQEIVHVALGIHDPNGNYCRQAGALLASLFANTQSSVCAHILHNETLTAENAIKLRAIADCFGKTIRFYMVKIPL